jgi:hypothetical protein
LQKLQFLFGGKKFVLIKFSFYLSLSLDKRKISPYRRRIHLVSIISMPPSQSRTEKEVERGRGYVCKCVLLNEREWKSERGEKKKEE